MNAESRSRRVMAVTLRWPEKLQNKLHVHVPAELTDDASALFNFHGIDYTFRGIQSHCAFFTINTEDAHVLFTVMPAANWTRGTLILSGSHHVVSPRQGFYDLITQ